MKRFKNFFEPLMGQHGFSIMEILVALVLLSMMFILIPMGTGEGNRQKLEDAIDNFDRAVRFASNEAILRNSIVRIRIDLSADPVEYSVQFGPTGNFVLPKAEETSRMSLKEKEEYDKEQANVDQQFNNIEEFKEANAKLDPNVTIVGLASNFQGEIRNTGVVAIYFYPTGERDDALIFFSTPEELATLAVPAFEHETSVKYYQYTEYDQINMDRAQEDKMKEFYGQWLRE